MERILITGALGQLGQEFIKFFNKNNTYVLATDIRSPLKVLSCDFEMFRNTGVRPLKTEKSHLENVLQKGATLMKEL